MFLKRLVSVLLLVHFVSYGNSDIAEGHSLISNGISSNQESKDKRALLVQRVDLMQKRRKKMTPRRKKVITLTLFLKNSKKPKKPRRKPNKKRKPTRRPTLAPTKRPTNTPTIVPSYAPSVSRDPSSIPSFIPSSIPTSKPSLNPSSKPSFSPSANPSNSPSLNPSSNPSSSLHPSLSPSTLPSIKPSISSNPSSFPSTNPSDKPTNTPTSKPTVSPTSKPTVAPTSKPTASPTSKPTASPTSKPTASPTSKPTASPTSKPTASPTSKPTVSPTSKPTNEGIPREVILKSGETLRRNTFVSSPSGIYRAGMTSNGNFILDYIQPNTQSTTRIWSAGSVGADRCIMQGDGNLVCRDESTNKVLWKSGSSNHDGSKLIVDDAGRIAVIWGTTYIWMDGVPQGEYTAPSSPSLKFPIRGAFYYSWYPNTWRVENGDLAHFEPDLGYYNSGDPIVVHKHVDALTYANINVGIISWWGPDTNLDKARISQLMGETLVQNSPMKWSVYYEDEYANDYSVSRIKQDLIYLKKWFVWHKTWAHVNGKPLIFIWNESECEVTKRWMDATEGKWFVVTKLFGGYEACPVQPDGWHQYGPASAIERHRGYSYVISPGFWRADEVAPRLDRLSKSEWCGNVREMVDSGEPLQLITTFNEAGEGTIIEPSKKNWPSSSEYGYYLDCLHDITPVSNDWYHGSTNIYDVDGNMTWEIPKNAKPGDLLLMFMSRTDDYLPFKLQGWKYAASCFKSHNGQEKCWTIQDCTKMLNDVNCQSFPNGSGKDLATIIFYKEYKKYEPKIFKYEVIGTHPGWGFIVAVSGVNTSDPIRGFSGTSADDDADSIFPSVYGKRGDLLLLSMAFDDTTAKNDFLPPEGTNFIHFVNGSDEAGYIFSKVLTETGETGKLESIGPGGSNNKDALISLVLKGS